MLENWPGLIFLIYFLCLVIITAYCLMQFHLLVHYKSSKRYPGIRIPEKPDLQEVLPFVTFQLPVYNEYFVIERLIDNIMKIDYPADRFEVQILDDSTDETSLLAERKVMEYSKSGFEITHLKRQARIGYKAGALGEGLKLAKGDYIAIFDADFLPAPNFLKETISYFRDESVGLVQTRWDHINQNYSVLTRLQAFQLNVHFTIEQSGRKSANYLLQFNGTAGIWRRDAILDAGGWEADTLTEDLDLSYRAQLNGWKVIYLEDILSPAELPAEMNGLKSQQYRWMKGGAETARKLLPRVWASQLNPMQKIHATSHLLASTVFLFVFLLGVFSVPMLVFFNPTPYSESALSIFLISLIAIAAVYYVANVEAAWDKQNKLRSWFKFIFIFPLFLSLSMGLSFHNSIAVIQGFWGRRTPFVRTPKFNIIGLSGDFNRSRYLSTRVPGITIIEGFLALYFLMAIFWGLYIQEASMMIFHLLLFLGYSTIFIYSIKHLQYR